MNVEGEKMLNEYPDPKGIVHVLYIDKNDLAMLKKIKTHIEEHAKYQPFIEFIQDLINRCET